MFKFVRRVWEWFWATNKTLNYLLGRWVEIRGNVIHIDGIRLNLDNSGIPTTRKFRLMFDYEHAERHLVRDHIDPFLPIIELGGFIGGIACITNKMLQEPQSHVVVEANLNLISQLEHNRRINDAKFIIVPAAIVYDVEQAEVVANGMASHVSNKTGIKTQPVNTITLRRIIETHRFSPVNLICDIEGSEIEMLEREINEMRQHVQRLIIELHPHVYGVEATQAALERLQAAGFVIVDQIESVYALKNEVLS